MKPARMIRPPSCIIAPVLLRSLDCSLWYTITFTDTFMSFDAAFPCTSYLSFLVVQLPFPIPSFRSAYLPLIICASRLQWATRSSPRPTRVFLAKQTLTASAKSTATYARTSYSAKPLAVLRYAIPLRLVRVITLVWETHPIRRRVVPQMWKITTRSVPGLSRSTYRLASHLILGGIGERGSSLSIDHTQKKRCRYY